MTCADVVPVSYARGRTVVVLLTFGPAATTKRKSALIAVQAAMMLQVT
jgi:hypothetical protein